MDGYQFLANLFKSLVSLAWPAAFVGAVWLFREKLTELMPLLRLKYKDIDVSFRLDEAEKDAAQLPPPQTAPIEPTPEERSRFERLAEISPRAAILELRNDLEEALRFSYLMAGGEKSRPTASMSTMIRTLRNAGAIDDRTGAVLDDLRAIGNKAAHISTADFTQEDAMRFRSLLQQVVVRFPGAGLNTPAVMSAAQ